MDYVHVYSNGNEAEVWDRLCALESRRDPDLSGALRWVAMEAMRRARRNIERLIPRWEARGHKFGYAWAGAWTAKYVEAAPPLLGNPTAADLVSLDEYERARGPIPMKRPMTPIVDVPFVRIKPAPTGARILSTVLVVNLNLHGCSKLQRRDVARRLPPNKNAVGRLKTSRWNKRAAR